MMKTPFVSIVMCTYNGSNYIDEQIQSILLQQYAHFELIIVDDASTDDTYKKLLEWSRQYPAIRLYQNENNLGYNANFARALELAKGEFISIADQDDIWMADKTSLLAEALQQPGTMLSHGMSIRLENGRLDYKRRKLQHHFSGSDARLLILFNPIMGHDMMFRRELLKFILPIPDRMSYDWWIAMNAVTRGNIASVKKILVHHRIHGNNSFFIKSTEVRSREMDIDEVWQTFLTIPALDGKTRKFLETSLGLIQRQTRAGTGFSLPLFFHLFKNRKKFFASKRRLLPVFSYIKNSIKYARMNFRGKGISF